MNFLTDYRLENYILNTKYADLPTEVKDRLRGCLIDLVGALLVGTRSEQFAVGLRFAERVFGEGNIAVIGTKKRLSTIGAAIAMGHASNAYDIDDGHNITRTHPGTSFIPALLAVGYEQDITLGELLSAMDVSYETSVRAGAALMDYYKYAHSSGTFGAIGIAAGVSKILGFTKEMTNNALSVAEFNAPLVPGIRSVEYPSMNKDGVPFGVSIGMLAIEESRDGFTGNKHILEADEYRHYLDTLGDEHTVMSLYFKPYPCCRWAHPAIDALAYTMRENAIRPDDIEHITVYTFLRATMLSKIKPKTCDEAQYNIAYPTATAAVYGTFGINHTMDEALADPKVLDMMDRLSFEVDPELDAKFPSLRLSRVTVRTKDGREYSSPTFEPSGEAKDNIGIEWLIEKFKRITAPVITSAAQDKILAQILESEQLPLRTLVDTIASPENFIPQ